MFFFQIIVPVVSFLFQLLKKTMDRFLGSNLMDDTKVLIEVFLSYILMNSKTKKNSSLLFFASSYLFAL